MNIFKNSSGLLSFIGKIPEPKFWLGYKYITHIFGVTSIIDHIVINFRNKKVLLKYNDKLLKIGGIQTEPFGVWPIDFCEELCDYPKEHQMYFAGVSINGGILILTASIIVDDQFDIFIKKRTELGIHHIAFKVKDVSKSINKWTNKGFIPLSKPIGDNEIRQVFLINEHGQLIELISRSKGFNNFTCNNISALKESERSYSDIDI